MTLKDFPASLPNQTDPNIWNQHFYFELKDQVSFRCLFTLYQLADEIAEVPIIFTLLNKHYFANSTIGQYEDTVSSVYLAPDHKIEHTWVALTNPDSEILGKVTGILKVSMSVTGPGEKPSLLSLEIGKSDNCKLLMAPSIKRKFK